jgi:hypothetical protein
MKLVIKYLDRLKDNIKLIERVRREHKFLIDIIERENYSIHSERIKQMRDNNNKLYEFMIDDNFLNAL